MVWDPTRITPMPWLDVVAFYRGLEDRNDDFRPLRALAEHVAARRDVASLRAATSGTALLVAPASVNAGGWATEAVRVDVELSGAVRLVLPAQGGRAAQSAAIADRALVGAVERFMRDAKWLPDRD